MSTISFTIIDTIGEKHFIETTPHSYHSLMELITNELLEDIGDCMGRAWCGTCIVKQKEGDSKGILKEDEINLLKQYPNNDNSHIRLSCQMNITAELNNTCWEIVDSRLSI